MRVDYHKDVEILWRFFKNSKSPYKIHVLLV